MKRVAFKISNEKFIETIDCLSKATVHSNECKTFRKYIMHCFRCLCSYRFIVETKIICNQSAFHYNIKYIKIMETLTITNIKN